jgi:hypothetical protein
MKTFSTFNFQLSIALALALLLLLPAACQKDDITPDEPVTPRTGTENLRPIDYPKQARSTKRGVSFSNNDPFFSGDFAKIGTGLSWFYTWGNNHTNFTAEQTAAQMDFYPMAWNAGYNANQIRAYKQAHPECEYILAFNEPCHGDQANMTPAQAAAEWPRLKALADELGMKLVSPALTYGNVQPQYNPVGWFDQFFALVSPDDVDAIAIHSYMNAPSAIMWYVGLFYKYNKPIWLTEFCAWDDLNANNYSVAGQQDYMCDVLNFLESDPHIARYAWFILRTGGSDSTFPYMQLMYNNRSELKDLGKMYVNFSSQDKNTWYEAGEMIPAEHYSSMNIVDVPDSDHWTNSVRVRPSTDTSGVLMVTEFTPGKWVEYQLDLREAGDYTVNLRYASEEDSEVRLSTAGAGDKGTISLPATGGFTQWKTATATVALPAGKQTLRLTSVKEESYLNWLAFL